METRDIITELEQANLESLIKCIDQEGDKTLLLKFSANWCQPCKSVAQLCTDNFSDMPDNVIIVVIDIDEALDLYMFLKKREW